MFSNGIFYSASDFYKAKFGCKVYKIALDAGCTCPNRDGTKGTGGCIFCSAAGSGDFIEGRKDSIREQLEKGKNLVKDKNGRGKYIGYFQNFTSTYGEPAVLAKKYMEAVEFPEVEGIAVATRPDCLNEEILYGLGEISREHYVSIELGFQSQKKETVEYIRRCYENEMLFSAVEKIRKFCPSAHIVTHVIFGLPGENTADMLETVKYVLKSGTDGIKIALLHVLSGTDLEKDYAAGKFKCLEMTEYFKLLGEALRIIPENVVVHRLTGDGPKKILIAPEWTGNKKLVYNSMLKYFRENKIVQGCGL